MGGSFPERNCWSEEGGSRRQQQGQDVMMPSLPVCLSTRLATTLLRPTNITNITNIAHHQLWQF